jgi:hypothetical protein
MFGESLKSGIFLRIRDIPGLVPNKKGGLAVLNVVLLAQMMDWNEGGWFWMGLMMIVGAVAVVLLIYFLSGLTQVQGDGAPGKEGRRPSMWPSVATLRER